MMKNFNKLLCGLLLIFSFAIVNTVYASTTVTTRCVENIDRIIWSTTSHSGKNEFTFIVKGKEKNTQNVISFCDIDSNAIRFVKDVIDDKKYALIKIEERKAWLSGHQKNIVLLIEIHINDDNDVKIIEEALR